MKGLFRKNIPLPAQFFWGLGSITLVIGLCFFWSNLLDYRTISLILLMTVAIFAMVLDFIPVLVSAVISALCWDFFFIPPVFTFHIDHTDDALLFLLYFLIASVHAVLTNRIRREKRKVADQEEKNKQIALYATVFNSLSHELKTPLSTLIGASDTLLENGHALNEPQKEELLTQIQRASLRLSRNLDNLLNMSRLESGHLEPKPDWCDVEELCRSSIHEFENTNRFQLEVHDPLPLFKLDEGWLYLILHNLLHNAVRHTPEGTPIKITLAAHNNLLQLRLEDKGAGIPEESLSLVFDKFYRINPSAGGSGLGLSIVKGFAQALNGTIGLQNAASGGLIVNLEIPASTTYLQHLHHE